LYPASITADEDLILLSHARYLIPEQGGFGALAAKVAATLGATVLFGKNRYGSIRTPDGSW